MSDYPAMARVQVAEVAEPSVARPSEVTAALSDAAAWAAVGEACGLMIGLLVPDAWVSDWMVGHLSASLFVAAYRFGILSQVLGMRTPRGRRLRDSLIDIDTMFAHGLIDEDEHRRLRAAALEKYAP